MLFGTNLMWKGIRDAETPHIRIQPSFVASCWSWLQCTSVVSQRGSSIFNIHMLGVIMCVWGVPEICDCHSCTFQGFRRDPERRTRLDCQSARHSTRHHLCTLSSISRQQFHPDLTFRYRQVSPDILTEPNPPNKHNTVQNTVVSY